MFFLIFHASIFWGKIKKHLAFKIYVVFDFVTQQSDQRFFFIFLVRRQVTIYNKKSETSDCIDYIVHVHIQIYIQYLCYVL